jgi:FkbM family methyltransferase
MGVSNVLSEKNLANLTGAVRAFGWRGFAKLYLHRRLRRSASIKLRVAFGGNDTVVEVRPTDSDLFVAAQVIGATEYRLDARRTASLRALAGAWRADGKVPLIIDAGANVGYSTLFLAAEFPHAMVIALEPERHAFAMLQKNTAGNSRIIAMNAALWSSDEGVELKGGGNDSWSTQTAPGRAGARVPSRTLEQVVQSIEGGALLIAKIDIEGAEREACRGSIPLLRQTPCIMIEPHDYMILGGNCLGPILSAVSSEDFDTLVRGENLVFVRSHLGRA